MRFSLKTSWYRCVALVGLIILSASSNAEGDVTLGKLIEVSRKRHPEILHAAASLRKAEIEHVQAKRLITANPDLEISLDRGSKQSGPDYALSGSDALRGEVAPEFSFGDLRGKSNQSVRGYEIGISQEVDLSGRRLDRLEETAAALSLARIEYQLVETRVRSELRAYLIEDIVLKSVALELRQVLSDLHGLRKQVGVGFVDPGLGGYITSAMDQDILELETQAGELELRQSLLANRLEVLSGLELTRSTVLTPKILGEIPAWELIEVRFRENNPSATISALRIKQAEAKGNFYEKSVIPNVTFFVSGGQRDIAPGPDLVGKSGEKENNVRFGLRVPLPIFERNQAESALAWADIDKEKLNVEANQRFVLSTLRASYEKYKLAKRNFDMRLKLRRVDKPKGLYAAFLMGRISYRDVAEFHSRIVQHYLSLHKDVLSAMENLSTVELLTGKQL